MEHQSTRNTTKRRSRVHDVLARSSVTNMLSMLEYICSLRQPRLNFGLPSGKLLLFVLSKQRAIVSSSHRVSGAQELGFTTVGQKSTAILHSINRDATQQQNSISLVSIDLLEVPVPFFVAPVLA